MAWEEINVESDTSTSSEGRGKHCLEDHTRRFALARLPHLSSFLWPLRYSRGDVSRPEAWIPTEWSPIHKQAMERTLEIEVGKQIIYPNIKGDINRWARAGFEIDYAYT